MNGYRIRAMTLAGVTVFQISHPTEQEWTKYWTENVMTQTGLSIFAGCGKVILYKEHLSPETGVWTIDLATPVEVS